MSESQADKIWNMVKGLPLDIYGLADQTVEMHVKRVSILPDQVHLILKSGAVLPALEEALSKVRLSPTDRFELDRQVTYTILKIVPKVL